MKIVFSAAARVALLVGIFNVVTIGSLALSICAGCATTATTTTSPDAVRCTREPVGAWEHIPSPYGGEHKHSDNGRPTRLSIVIDITPLEKDGGGSVIVIDTTDQLGGGRQDYIYLPPSRSDYKPLERIIRCLKGAMERRYEEWKTTMPFSYTPAPTGKKGSK